MPPAPLASPASAAPLAPLAPPQPSYVFRGHSAAIHAVHFLRDNTRLLTGDAEGWVVLWDVLTRRPAATWRPHGATILGLGSWADDKIITHGRDSKLHVWSVTAAEESSLSQQLPVTDCDRERPAPRIIHTLDVHTLNFCSFASIVARDSPNFLIAVPGLTDGSVILWSLPFETALGTLPPSAGDKTGMIMALSLLYYHDRLTVVAGHENGLVSVHAQQPDQSWTRIRRCNSIDDNQQQPKQPLLSLDLLIRRHLYVLHSSADSKIVAENVDLQTAHPVNTGHAGQQALKVRSDGTIFATAGWDGRGRVYGIEDPEQIRELAVLKYHAEGCYALDFARILDHRDPNDTTPSSAVTKRSQLAGQRARKALDTHWLALGSKDGRVSLWDIF